MSTTNVHMLHYYDTFFGQKRNNTTPERKWSRPLLLLVGPENDTGHIPTMYRAMKAFLGVKSSNERTSVKKKPPLEEEGLQLPTTPSGTRL